MFGFKACLALGAILLACFAASAVAECKNCQGSDLIEFADIYAQKEKCWFNKRHHYLLKFKVELLNSSGEQFEILIKNSNAKAPANCRVAFQPTDCMASTRDLQANCHIRRVKSLATTYNTIEKCAGEALDLKQLSLVFKLMYGQIMGWKQIHETCYD